MLDKLHRKRNILPCFMIYQDKYFISPKCMYHIYYEFQSKWWNIYLYGKRNWSIRLGLTLPKVRNIQTVNLSLIKGSWRKDFSFEEKSKIPSKSINSTYEALHWIHKIDIISKKRGYRMERNPRTYILTDIWFAWP